ncbi:YbaB/EbfC family nucleoid-associated protein [Legionella micdadei]|uniref:Uncharacterized protein n=1 Tax=Legionella micdadei TaxID=451 RepID=A0A098GFJ8_LEGMI|nr:YbaB/EbfC family nucleoid-associated protein [Legionella micdadei]ARG97280.1 hypothetical protein B6N58_06175 [Legionella micdadei]ARH00415.1 hypothetical protein B6V88_08255 [Legionella micdadei]KTD28157.1 hypothetical protein Lmic_1268 [Legionella micdadei]NSL16787.1 YbaB/EbfC family nucleoid-associated protein [Legionella micdadei]CEG61259.1 protein of unknown function [Legionella micdadei]
MKNSTGIMVDENIMKALGAHTAKAIRVKSAQMEAAIAAKLEDLEFLVVEGFSNGKLVKAKVDGNHQLLELSFDPSYSDWDDKTKTCALMLEAVNDALYKVDLAIETEISTIKYEYVGEVIRAFEKKD